MSGDYRLKDNNYKAITKMRYNKLRVLFGLGMVLLSVNCCTEYEEVNEPPLSASEILSFDATWAVEPYSKTEIQDDGVSVWWTVNESINVFYGASLEGEFVSTNTEKKENVRFEGYFNQKAGSVVKDGQSVWAVYPYNSENTCNGYSVYLTIPQIQTAAEGTFADKLFPGVAKSDGGSHLSFYNIGGGACFSVTESGVSSVCFRGAERELLAGKIQVGFGDDGVPVIQNQYGGYEEVIVNAPDGGSFEVGKLYYAVFVPQTLNNGLTVEMIKADKHATLTIDKPVVVKRSRFGVLSEIDKGLTYREAIPDNEIWYYSSDGEAVTLYDSSGFGSSLRSNTYENGKGILRFRSTVSTVGKNAFMNCTSLLKVILPDKVSIIDECAFYKCSSLSDIKLPDGLQVLKRDALYDCASLVNVLLPDGLKELGPGSFGECKSLDSLLIPVSVETIGSRCFEGCDGIQTMDLSHLRITALPDKMFYFCSGLQNVYLPATLQKLGFGVFDHSAITELFLPSSFNGTVTSATCQGCDKLKTIQLGAAAIIQDYAFSGCTSMEEVCLPDTITEIGEYAFSGCTSLKELHIPDGVTSLGEGFVQGCSSLERVTGPFSLSDNRSVAKDGVLLGFAGSGLGVFSYVLPDGITRIGGGVFSNDNHLENIVLNEGVETVGDYAFSGCSLLKSVSMPMVKELGEGVFSKCTSLEQVDLSDELTEIPRNLYNGCTSLKKAVIPDNVLKIGLRAFKGCSSLDSLYCVPIAPPAYDDLSGIIGLNDPEIFKGCPATLKILIGEEELQAYSLSDWRSMSNYFVAYHYVGRSSPSYYISSDYSRDGEVALIQQASIGNGINIVVMGDAFADKDIQSGFYSETMNKMAENFFSEEPYKTYRDCFNVYAVTVVSVTEGYEHYCGKLQTFFGGGTRVGGNNGVVRYYAKKAVPEELINNALVLVAMNRHYYAGTCYMFYSNSSAMTDYGEGLSIAYFPLGTDEEMFRTLLCHEAAGHGFAKLADEYNYSAHIPESEKQSMQAKTRQGWWKNIDFINDPLQVKWSRFLSDSRYSSEGLGVFEGACTYAYGAYRPSLESMMRHNTGGFNAPSREAIWYRIHKLAFGDSWHYNYEDFVAYDLKNIPKAPRNNKVTGNNKVYINLPPLAPPVVIEEY